MELNMKAMTTETRNQNTMNLDMMWLDISSITRRTIVNSSFCLYHFGAMNWSTGLPKRVNHWMVAVQLILSIVLMAK